MTNSAKVQDKILEFLADGAVHTVQEIKNYLSLSELDYTEGQFSGSINTLLRNGSIRKLDRAKYAMNNNSEGGTFMRKCFVVSPIGDEGTEIRRNADMLFKYIISPICEECGFEAVRVDKMNDFGSITDTIMDELRTADLVIADLTGKNPNVFYEIGFRNCLGKPAIHLKSKEETIPFDVSAIRTLEYDLKDLDSVAEVKERLKQTINSFDFEYSETEADDKKKKEPSYSDLLSAIYNLQDSVSEIKNRLDKKDTNNVQNIFRPSSTKSDYKWDKNIIPVDIETHEIIHKIPDYKIVRDSDGLYKIIATAADKKDQE